MYPLPQVRSFLNINFSCGNVTYLIDFVHRLTSGDNVQEYTDSIFCWPVKIVTIDAEYSSQTFMSINQTC